MQMLISGVTKELANIELLTVLLKDKMVFTGIRNAQNKIQNVVNWEKKNS